MLKFCKHTHTIQSLLFIWKLCLEIQVLLIYIKWKIHFDRSFVTFVKSDVSNAQRPYEFLTDVDWFIWWPTTSQ